MLSGCLQSFQPFSVSALSPCLSAPVPHAINGHAPNEFNEHSLAFYVEGIDGIINF